MTAERFTWHIEAVLPPTQDRRWAKNIQVQVVTETLERAVAACRDRYPTAVFIKVLRDRYTDEVIVLTPAGNPSGDGS